MRKTKVLHVIPTLSGGGAERQLVDIVSNTSRKEFEHTICLLRSENFYLSKNTRTDVEIVTLDLKGKYPWLGAARKINKVVKEVGPDIIHSWLFDGDATSRLVKLFHREIPLITSLQTIPYEPETIEAGGLSPIKVRGLRIIDSGLARLTDPYFVACSNFVAASAMKWLGVKRSRISVIYNSVDLETLVCEPCKADRLREDLGISSGEFVYLGVGRLDAGKGFADLIRAFFGVIDRAPDSKLVIVGKGPMEDALSQLIVSLDLESNVLLVGERNDIGCFLEMADAFVFPTRFEGLGIALIEAMSKGLPCIASRLPVLEEVITHEIDGLLVDPDSTLEWIDSMIRIRHDDEFRSRLGEAAVNTITERFTSNVLMPKWEELYRMIFNSKI